MSQPKKKPAPPLTIRGPNGETVVRDGTPNVCCHMLDYVLEQEKPMARTGLFRPLMTFEHAPNNKLKQKDGSRDVCFRATGRKAQNIFLNYCPFCGDRLQPETNGKATKAKAAERRGPARPRQLQTG